MRRILCGVGVIAVIGVAAVLAGPTLRSYLSWGVPPNAGERSGCTANDGCTGTASPGDAWCAMGGAEQAEHVAGGDLSMSIEQILAARCEHQMETYRCDECRYEVGVVRLAPGLVQGEGTAGLVGLASIEKGKVVETLVLNGTIDLNENTAAHVSSPVRGVIATAPTPADIGAEVPAGAELLAIDSIELGQALNAYMKSSALLALAQKSLEREQKLFERGVSAEQGVLAAQTAIEERQAEFQAAAQTLRVFGLSTEEVARLRQGGVVNGRLPIRAGKAGTVIQKHAVPGELVEPGASVMLLADLRALWVWADVYEHDLARITAETAKGPLAAEIDVDGFPGRVFRGTCDYVGAVMDPKSRTVKMRIATANEDRALRPGMFCRVRVALGAGDAVLSAPADAVLQDEGASFVFVPLKDDFFVRRAVKAGRRFGDRVELLDGPPPGTQVAARGAFVLKSDVLRAKMGAGCAD